MSATNGMIERLRRMVNEPTTVPYSDSVLAEAIERYPLTDAFGYDPDDDNWTETYDLNAAAGDIWDEKAAACADEFDFDADGGSYSHSQKYEMAAKHARSYHSRRSFRAVELESTPKADEDNFE
jgi:hypothetical protein